MALQEEYEYICNIIIHYFFIKYWFGFFLYLAFRCAYCNYFNGSRKEKPVFNGNIVAHDPQTATTISQPQNESIVERMEVSSSESSDSNRGIVFVHHSCINLLFS